MKSANDSQTDDSVIYDDMPMYWHLNVLGTKLTRWVVSKYLPPTFEHFLIIVNQTRILFALNIDSFHFDIKGPVREFVFFENNLRKRGATWQEEHILCYNDDMR